MITFENYRDQQWFLAIKKNTISDDLVGVQIRVTGRSTPIQTNHKVSWRGALV